MSYSNSSNKVNAPHEPPHFHDEPKARDMSQQQRILLLCFLIITGFMFMEALGGWLTHSLALLSDAGHMLSDAAALGATLLAFKIGEKSANTQKTFGYKRFEILVAGANGATLIIIAIMIVIEAIERLYSPPEIATKGMLFIAFIGMLVNLLVAWLLHRSNANGHNHHHCAHHHNDNNQSKNLNMHSAYLHVLGDLLGSVAAIIAALAMIWFGWAWADPIVSVIVASLIFISGYRVVKASTHILMEGTPADISLDEVTQAIKNHAAVIDVHDMHIWSITSGIHALSCHVIVSANMPISSASALIAELELSLQDLGISHTTIQVESKHFSKYHNDALGCIHPETHA